jgi:hypothetical protein
VQARNSSPLASFDDLSCVRRGDGLAVEPPPFRRGASHSDDMSIAALANERSAGIPKGSELQCPVSDIVDSDQGDLTITTAALFNMGVQASNCGRRLKGW